MAKRIMQSELLPQGIDPKPFGPNSMSAEDLAKIFALSVGANPVMGAADSLRLMLSNNLKQKGLDSLNLSEYRAPVSEQVPDMKPKPKEQLKEVRASGSVAPRLDKTYQISDGDSAAKVQALLDEMRAGAPVVDRRNEYIGSPALDTTIAGLADLASVLGAASGWAPATAAADRAKAIGQAAIQQPYVDALKEGKIYKMPVGLTVENQNALADRAQALQDKATEYGLATGKVGVQANLGLGEISSANRRAELGSEAALDLGNLREQGDTARSNASNANQMTIAKMNDETNRLQISAMMQKELLKALAESNDPAKIEKQMTAGLSLIDQNSAIPEDKKTLIKAMVQENPRSTIEILQRYGLY